MAEVKWYREEDGKQLAEALLQYGSFAEVAKATRVPVTTLKSAARDFGIVSYGHKGGRENKPGFAVSGDSAEVVLPPGVKLGDVREMIVGHGLDPDEWDVTNVVVNQWDSIVDGEVTPMRQLKVFLRRRVTLAQLFPAKPLPVIRFPKVEKPKRDGELWVFTSCWQAPYHDEAFHKAFCKWLNVNRPDHGVDLGDLMDLPTVSKHRDNPAYFASVQTCVDTAYRLLHERREASPGTEWSLLEGNHDERLRTELLLRAERMYGVRPAQVGETPEREVLSMRSLLHLDALNINLVSTPNGGNYEHAEVRVSEQLVARHGWLTGPNAGARTVEKVGTSVIVGHTHMQGVQIVPRWYRGRLDTMIGVEVGCGCRVDADGLGYAAQPRWVQGFATAWVWENGEFTVDLARFEDGHIRWGAQRIAA